MVMVWLLISFIILKLLTITLLELPLTVCECDDDNFEPLTSIEVEQLLSKTKPTGAGCDGIQLGYFVVALISFLILLHT